MMCVCICTRMSFVCAQCIHLFTSMLSLGDLCINVSTFYSDSLQIAMYRNLIAHNHMAHVQLFTLSNMTTIHPLILSSNTQSQHFPKKVSLEDTDSLRHDDPIKIGVV